MQSAAKWDHLYENWREKMTYKKEISRRRTEMGRETSHSMYALF